MSVWHFGLTQSRTRALNSPGWWPTTRLDRGSEPVRGALPGAGAVGDPGAGQTARLYLTAKGHLVSGGSVIAMGEIVKVTLVKQVIEITKPKLLSFHWFARLYSGWEAVLDRLRSAKAWQAMKRRIQSSVARVRRMKADMEAR